MNILNLFKTQSLYKNGMKPVEFNVRKFLKQNPQHVGEVDPLQHREFWTRGCENIKYVSNGISRFSDEEMKT